MTDRRNRQRDRAVRAYMREHPGTTLPQAREAVTARASHQDSRPARLLHAPQPRPGEALPDYVKRVAAALGTHRHRAMELLGLEPGTSAAGRMTELAAGLAQDTVRALSAATGMSPDQARALASPATGPGPESSRGPRADETVRRVIEQHCNDKSHRRASEGKTQFSCDVALSAIAARPPRFPAVDYDGQRTLDWPGPSPSPWIISDTPWPADGSPLPADLELFDALTGGTASAADAPHS
ncbi:hypothetical protein ABZ502_17155 [Streptomyces abikoensis]|uniref:hypothetical protein n=1 Tax=Streptomyces abikoensis TaxID=97398 RepID=UPI0033EEBE5B